MPLRARRYIGRSVISSPLSRTLAGIGPGQTNDHVESGGLAGAVGSQQPDDFALTDFHFHVVYNFTPLVGLAEFDGLELQHTSVVVDQVAESGTSLLDSVFGQRTRTIFRIDDDRIIR